MDILDIDEILKDDSFCLMDTSGQDDISNILQQWRQQNGSSPGGKFDTRTFTRPKRRSAQNFEANFASASNSDNVTHLNPNINLKIGGLVTSMEKSCLQDTSPPSSLSSSIDVSIERMENSLITSGDFQNVSFFKTTNVEDILAGAEIDGYSFDDMIKDRKALENLSLSGDSAIIKDSNIAQIDEITYLSKTNSGNSTMQNSTESMPSGVNETFTMLNQTTVPNVGSCDDLPLSREALNKLSKDNWNSVTQDDLICNTTMSLIDSTHILHPATDVEDDVNLILGKNQPEAANVAFSKTNKEILNTTYEKIPVNCSSTIMNRTYYRRMGEDHRSDTFDCTPGFLSDSENRNEYDSPKVDHNNSKDLQSTPCRNPAAKPSIASLINVNISPIVPAKREYLTHENDVDEQTKTISNKTIDQLEKYLERLSSNCSTSSEEQIEYVKEENQYQTDALAEMEYFENVELLTAENNEDEFDDMLEKLGKSCSINESVKLRQSLDNIKKKHSLANYEKIQDLTPKHSETNLDMSRILSDSMGKSSLSSSSSSERLLSRRSRLYDDIQVIMPVEISHTSMATEDNTKKAIAKTDNNPILPNTCSVECKTEPSLSTPPDTQIEVKRNRDPERFKTIRIFKKTTENDIIVPCIDSEIEQNINEHPVSYVDQSRFSRKDNNSPVTTVFNNNKSEVEPNNIYQTYKKPRNITKYAENANSDNGTVEAASKENGKPKSLSRPKQLSGLPGRSTDFTDDLPKANSASDIHKTFNSNATRKLSNFGTFAKAQNTLKSPMGTKAKSFTNLTGPFGFSSKLSMPKQNSQPSLALPLSGTSFNKEKTLQSDRISFINRPTSKKPSTEGVEKNEKTVFKIPHPISNLRVPNSRRSGLMRPSSGFYSHTVTKNDAGIETGRFSPSNSLSSASSRGSSQDCQQAYTNGHVTESSTSTEEIQILSDNIPANETKALSTQKNGILKPSGLRPPSNMRKSGLPRPSSIVRK